MPKNEVKSIVVAGDELDKLIKEYLEEKSKKDTAEKNMTYILRIFEKMAGYEDPEAPVEEGSLDLKGGEGTVRLKFKMNKAVDKDEALRLCAEYGFNVEDVFNVRPEYPTGKILDRINHWDGEDRDKALAIIEKVTTTKRAKTSVEVK